MLATTSTVVAVLTVMFIVMFPPSVPRLAWVPFAEPLARLVSLGFGRTQLTTAILAFLVMTHALATTLAFGKHQYGLAAGVIVLAWLVVPHGLRRVIKGRERILRNQIADAALVMAAAARAGMAPAMSLTRAAADIPAPLGPHLVRLVRDYERGSPLRAATLAARERLELDAFTLMTTAVDVNLECGGRLDEALCQIAENIGDQQRLEDKLDAATASGRHALLLMALFPVGFTAFLYRLDPGGFDAISASTTGQIGIGVSLLIIYLAVRWGMAILDRVGI